MLNALGKFLRKLRVDNDELMKDMAEKLSLPASTLSAVENGNRKAPDWFIGRVTELYGLSKDQEDELALAVATASKKKELKIGLGSLTKNDQEFALAFARRFSDLTDETKDEIRRIMNEEGKKK